MDRLLSIKLRKATNIDVENVEKDNTKAVVSGYLYEPMIQMDDLLKVLDDKDDKKEENKPEEPSVVPVEERNQEEILIVEDDDSDKIKISNMDDEGADKLLSRLPPLGEEFDEKPNDGDVVIPKETVKRLPTVSQTKQIEFPPKEQREKARAVSGRSQIPLKINSFTPTLNQLYSRHGRIQITFNQPMYEEELKISHKKEQKETSTMEQKRHIQRIVHITPDLPKSGTWVWETQNTCVFSTKQNVGPDGLFNGSTEYSVVIPRGTKSAKGGILEETFTAKFRTPILSVKKYLPSNSYYKINTQNPILGMQFSQDVDPNTVLQKLKIQKEGKLIKKKLKPRLLEKEEVIKAVNEHPFYLLNRNTQTDPITVFSDSLEYYEVEKERNDPRFEKPIKYKENVLKDIVKKDVFFFTVDERLDQDTLYKVTVEKDLESVHGNMNSTGEYSFSFHTLKKLEVMWNTPMCYEYDKIEWKLEFTNPLNLEKYEKNAKDWISLENIQNPQVWIEGRYMNIKGRIERNVKKVKIVLGKDIEDVFNNIFDKKKEFVVNVNIREFYVTTDKSNQMNFYDDVDWYINFNLNLNEYHFDDNVDKLVTVDPPLFKQKISRSGRRAIKINGSPIGSSTFTVKISPDLQSCHETLLKKEAVVKFKVKKVDPSLQSIKGNVMEVIDPTIKQDVAFSFYVRNIKKIRVLVFKVEPKDYYTCPLGPNKMKIRDYSHESIDLMKLVNLPKEKIVFDEMVETKGKTNEKKRIDFSLEKFLENGTGNLFVVCEYPKKKEVFKSIYTWIQVTKVSIDAFWQNQSNLIMIANSLIDGSLIQNPVFEIQYVGKAERKYLEIPPKEKDGEKEPKVIWECNYPTVNSIETLGNVTGLSEQMINIGHSSNFQVVLKNDGDYAFLPNIGRSFSQRENQLISFVFDDKKIFKPKEKCNVKGILRMINFADQNRKMEFLKKGEKIKYEIFDSQKVKFIESELEVDDCSSFYFNFVIPENVNLGDCEIKFEYLTGNAIIGKHFSHSFKLEEFKEPEFDTKCSVFEKDQHSIDENVLVTSTAKYYSGGGLSDCKTNWKLKQSLIHDFKPPNYFSFNFKFEKKTTSYFSYQQAPKVEHSLTDTTNDKGESKVLIECKNPMHFVTNRLPDVQYNIHNIPPKFPTVYTNLQSKKVYALPIDLWKKSKELFLPIRVTCTAEVVDLSQNVLRSSSNFVVHPCEFYIGVKQEKGTVVFGENHTIDIVVCDANGKCLKDRNIAVEVFKSGGYNSNFNRVNNFFIKSEGKEQSVKIDFCEQWKSGVFTIVLTGIDEHGLRAITSIDVRVNENEQPRKIDIEREMKNMERSFLKDFPIDYKEELIETEKIDILMDKNEYKIGDEAEITLVFSSKFVGHGIFLVYTTKVMHRQQFYLRDTETKEMKFKVNVTEDYFPNFVVFAYMFGKQYRRDINGFEIDEKVCDDVTEIFRPGHQVGKVNVSVSAKSFEIEVKVIPKDLELTPGAESEVAVKVNKAGKSVLTLFIVDESVLALTGYKMKLDIDFFFPKTRMGYSGEVFLRNYIYEKKLKANEKRIKEKIEELKKSLEKKYNEAELKHVNLKRNEEFRKMLANELEEKDKKLVEKLKALWEERNKIEMSQVKTRREMRDIDFDSFEDESETIVLCEKTSPQKYSLNFNAVKKSKPKLKKRKKKRKMKKVSKRGKIKECLKSAPQMSMDKQSFAFDDDEDEEDEEEVPMLKTEEKKEENFDDDDTPIAMRKLFESTVIFTTCVVTDDDGNSVIPFKLPDNLTRYRIYCLAENGVKYFGLGESSFVSKLPFSIRDSMPTFLNYGDYCFLKFILSNQTDNTLKIRCAARTSSNLKIADDNRGFYVSVPKHKRAEVTIPIETKAVGESKVQIGASAAGFSDAVEKKITVFTPTIAQAFVYHGQMSGKDAVQSQTQQILPPSTDEVYNGFGGLELEMSSTIIQSMSDAFLYTYNYQFDCVEQCASRILSIISMYDIVKDYKFGDVSLKDGEKVLKESLKKLCKRQESNGAFGMWKKGEKCNPYISTLAAHAVVRTREKFPNYFTDFSTSEGKDFEKLLNQCKKFCFSISSYFPLFKIKKLSTQSLRSFSLYVLAHYSRLGLLSDSEKSTACSRTEKLFKEFQKKSNGTLESRAWLAYSLSQFSKKGKNDEKIDSLRQTIFKSVVDEKGMMYFANKMKYEYETVKVMMVGSSDVRSNGVILEVLCYLDEPINILTKIATFLLKIKKMGRWANTNENSQCLLAIMTFLQKVEKNEPNFEVDVWLKDFYCGGTQFKGRSTDKKLLKIPMDKICISAEEKEKIEKEKMILFEKFEENRQKREENESERKKKEKEEREKEKEKSKKKGFFAGVKSLLGGKDASDDIDFFAKQIEKRDTVGDKEAEMEENLIKEISNKKLLIQKSGKGALYYRLSMKYAPKDLKLDSCDFGFKISRTYHECEDPSMKANNTSKPNPFISYQDKQKEVVEEKESTFETDPRTGNIRVKVGSLVRVRLTIEVSKPRYQIALVDQIPAGLEALNPNLKTTIDIPPDTDSRYNSTWHDHINYRMSRIEVFKDMVNYGTYRFTYVCRAKHLGRFISTPAKVHEMYDEDIFGTTETRILEVVKKL